MVFILDDDGQIEISLEEIWKLMYLHGKEGAKIHPDGNPLYEMPDENTLVKTWEQKVNDKTTRLQFKSTFYPPLGRVTEMLEGPLKGSKFFTYYQPEGSNRTNITVVGDFRSSVLSDAQIRAAVEAMMTKSFKEDTEFLEGMS